MIDEWFILRIGSCYFSSMLQCDILCSIVPGLYGVLTLGDLIKSFRLKLFSPRVGLYSCLKILESFTTQVKADFKASESLQEFSCLEVFVWVGLIFSKC